MKTIILTFFVLITLNSAAQSEIISQEYYEGTINNNIEISFYLKVYEDECPTVYADAIYSYTKNGGDEWILLKSTFSEDMEQYTFVEFFNTGILLLKKEATELKGLWISPDGKKQFDVVLKKIKIDSSKIESLEDALERKNYEAHDC